MDYRNGVDLDRETEKGTALVVVVVRMETLTEAEQPMQKHPEGIQGEALWVGRGHARCVTLVCMYVR